MTNRKTVNVIGQMAGPETPQHEEEEGEEESASEEG